MPEDPISPVGKITFSDELNNPSLTPNSPVKPVGNITFDGVTDMSLFAAPKDSNIEPIIEELARTSRGGLKDSEKDMLRQMLTNPNLTGEQAKRGIAAIQGYDPKQSEDNTFYYLKQEDNGVMVPQALAKGERPPEGYDVARVFSSPSDAKDDSWYTDVAKSVYNGAFVAAEGLLSLAQQGSMAVTGEEVEYLNKLRNTADALKIYKDEDLNKSFVKSENIKKPSDLLNIENYDISPESIWGTVNMLIESVTATYGGGSLVKAAPAIKALVGSYISQISDNLDGAREVGLSEREASGLAAVQTGAMAALDAIGLDKYIFANPAKSAKKELFKKLAVELPRNADGTFTKEAIGELTKKLPFEYVKIGMKEYGKGVTVETITETGQEFVKRASEQLWDKLSDDDKAKFGTEIDSPEAFAAYAESTLGGLIGGLGMGGLSTNYKQKYNEQSSNVFNVVKQGESAVNELKANLGVARDKGQLSEEEYNQAIFKVDAYKVYNDQVADQGLSDQEKKEAFELSFNIEALKSEIPTKKEDIEGLDPIGQAKIAAKKELMNGLQKELNLIIQKKENEKETKVAEETKTKTEPEEKKGVDELLKKYGKTEKGAKVVDENTINKATKPPRAKRSAVDNTNWATKMTAQEKKQILQEEAKTAPNNEIGVTLIEGQNKTIIGVLDDGKRVDFMQSVDNPNAKVPNYFNYKGLPPKSAEKYVDEAGQELDKYEGTVPIKRVEIDAFEIDENGKEIPSFDSDGNRNRKAVLVAYNPKTGDRLGFVRENSPVNGIYYANKNYTPTEKLELNKLNDINYLSDEITPYLYRPKPEGASEKAKEPKKSDAQEVGQGGQDNVREEGAETGVQRKLTPREKELKSAAKPKIELEYVANQDALVKDVKVDVSNSEGTTDTVELPLKDVQKNIRKTMSLLKQVLDCVHG